MGKKILVNVNCSMEIDEDSLRLSPESREEDIQNEIEYAIQRVQNGFDERVSWSIDYYLNENMPKWLSSLSKQGTRTPSLMFTNEELLNPDGISEEVDLAAHSRWEGIVQSIIDGFEAAKKIEDHWVQESSDNELWQKFNLGMDNFKKYYFCLWD